MDYLTNLEGAFVDCPLMQCLRLPKYLDNVTTITAMCRGNINLTEVIMPISMNKLSILGGGSALHGAFNGCTKISKIQYPLSLPLATTFAYINYKCSLATYYLLPTSMPNCTNISYSFYNNLKIKSLQLPKIMNKVISANLFIYGDTSLEVLNMPDSMILCTGLVGNSNLWNLDTISTCTFGTGMADVQFTFRDLKTFKQPTLRVSKFICTGQSLAVKSSIHTIDIDWANSTYGGTTPQIDIRWNSLSTTTINAIFTALPVVTGKTINVAGNPGSATCTPTIASLKGWTVIVL
jgi:hypothetical protein